MKDKLISIKDFIGGEVFLKNENLFVIKDIDGDIVKYENGFYEINGKIVLRCGLKFKDGVFKYYNYIKGYYKNDKNKILARINSSIEDCSREKTFLCEVKNFMRNKDKKGE